MTRMINQDGFSLGWARVLNWTDKALLVDGEDIDDEEWIPLSQIHEDSEVYQASSKPGTLVVTTWFAVQRGWL